MRIGQLITHSFLPILLALVGFFLLLKNDQVGIEVIKPKEHSERLHYCGAVPIIKIISNTEVVHVRTSYAISEMAQHIHTAYFEHPFDHIVLNAEENVSHEVVVGLSDKIVSLLPDIQIVWGSHSQSNKSMK